jgi:chemotaxis protein methyltransferase CheR
MIRDSRKSAPSRGTRTEEVEIRLLLEAIFQLYGYDFRDYDPAKVRSRILSRLRAERLESVSQYQHLILRDRACLERLIEGLIHRRRALFDPPGLWRLLRRKVVPVLRTYPTSKLWVAGCATGEEAYSLAILLQEEGLGSRSVVYATELDETILTRARQGWLSPSQFASAQGNYRLAGGRASLQRHSTRSGSGFVLNGPISGRIVFASHSLATDSSFNEFNVILCRNLLSQFAPALQGRARSLLHQSLGIFGYLALGNRESMNDARFLGCYEPFSRENHLYRRIR